MNQILLTIILTLLIHSFIGTVVYIATNENDDFSAYYGRGVIGLVLEFFFVIIGRIIKWFKYRNKRSIFEDENGNKSVKYANGFNWYYDIVKRHATKDEWKNLKSLTKEQIENAQKHCGRYRYDKDCTFDMYRASLDRIRCKHDMLGQVIEFDKFEKK